MPPTKNHDPSPPLTPGGDKEQHSLGETIRRYRLALGMDQSRLAELAGLGTKQAVSSIETGGRDVKAFELVRIGRALHASIEALLGVENPTRVPSVLWRRRMTLADGTTVLTSLRREREAQLRERAERYALLEEWCDAIPPGQLPEFDVDVRDLRYEWAGELADRMRSQLGLGSTPANTLEAVLTSEWGVKIFYDALGRDGESSAACVRDDEKFGCAVLVNADEAPVRQVFSLAHELFHLVTWSSVANAWEEDARGDEEPTWYASLERCAQSFAAALLIPADRVVAELARRVTPAQQPGSVTPPEPQHNQRIADRLRPSDYAFVAHASFGVSADALLWRLVSLRVLRRAEREVLSTHPELSAIAAQFTQRARAVDRSRSVFPSRFWELVQLAHGLGEVGIAQLATFAELPVVDLHELLTAPLGYDQGATPRVATETAAV